MPLVGFGIWKVPSSSAGDSVYNAIKTGYRLIDGAYDYMNSKEAGKGVQAAIADGLVKREDVFVTSKLWNNYHKKEHVVEMAKMENDAWGLGYLDAYLVHFPISLKYIPPTEVKYPCWWKDEARTVWNDLDPVPMSETWGAMETLALRGQEAPGKERFARSIGVSNFHTQLLYDLLSYAKIKPAVLQIEHHPYLISEHLVNMAQENGIAVTAYSTFGPASFVEMDHPLAKTAMPLMEHSTVKGIADKYGKTPAQVLLRWCTQRNVAVIPKSNHPERALQNLDCCTFDMTADELNSLSSLDCRMRFNDPGALDKPIRIWV
ncbi:hypothetical protein MKZ38_009641 [Zalerion maritima]|uniref:NADP-dependent oxidoreductase domain-containing protein n=1 Tax=Zalerion maritima TaxID=339359 RepID=A0AAD5WVL5_9PEZI|nr:hypothetical protein MKZ38_009641 [Zalerion maritima]